MIYIRTDMNETIATGHVMRCLSIADAVSGKGETVTFLLADHQAENLIQTRGHHTIVLNTDWSNLDAEIPVLVKLIHEKKIENLLIDSYQVTEQYLQTMTNLTRTIYIDDLNHFVYPVKALICYTNYWAKFNYVERYQNTELYCGEKYVPLRKEFQNTKPKLIRNQIENLLILSGGTDTYNVLNGILEHVECASFRSVTVICGMYHQNYTELCARYQNDKSIIFHKAVSNMKQYMEMADLVISAGGTTLYELCAVGTPTISYSFADNQLDNVKSFSDEGIIDYAGDARFDNLYHNISELVKSYQNNCSLRKLHSEKMKRLIDGRGAERIADICINLDQIEKRKKEIK